MSMAADEIIAVVQAHKEGKQIECRPRAGQQDDWTKADPIWNFPFYDYRVKPEPPKPREWWLNEYDFQAFFGPHPTLEAAIAGKTNGYLRSIHVREVLPETK